MRLTLWCTTLVVVSGTLVVFLVIVFTDQQLRANAPERRQPPTSVEPNPTGPTGRPPAAGRSRVAAEAADLALNASRRIGFELLAGLAGAALVASWFVAGRVLRPVRQLSFAASQISPTRLSDRINLQGPHDELKELADNFDAMLERLDRAFVAQRSFVADASHELRTPLTVMRAEVDVALDDPQATNDTLRSAIRVVGDSVQRMQVLSESLLALARAEVRLTTVPVDLADITRSAITTVQSLGFGDRVVTSQLDESPVDGDPVLLERLAVNLVENAIRHNRDGGAVNIATMTDNGFAVLVVENDGDLISDAEITTLFQRFLRRNDATATVAGSGIGLAISTSVANAHEGTITATPRPGGGLAVRVSLPRALAAEHR